MIITDISTKTNSSIALGRQMENEARQIAFDLSYLIDTYGEGTAQVVHQRSQDVAPYIVSTTRNGNSLAWMVSNTDTAYEGYGKAELRWTVGNTLAKTVTYKTYTVKSITGDTVIPSALQSWYDALIDYIDDHSIAPEDLAAAVAAYIEEHPISAPVTSVNSKTGDVSLSASDVGALPDDTVIPTVPTNVSAFTNDAGYGTYSKPSGGIPKSDLASAVQTSLGKADSALQSFTETDPTVPSWAKQSSKPSYTAQEVGALPSDTTIPTKVSQLQNDSGFGTYSKPSGGIPSSDMTSSVQTSLGKADSAYQKPSGGIPSTDMSSAVQTSLGKADTALQTAPVSSVNSKTGAVVLDAGDLAYSDNETYTSGTVGKEISNVKGDLSDIDNRVTALEEGGSGSGLTSDIKQALLQLAAKVAYIDDDGQDYYDDLHDALYTLVSISAVYTQSGTVYASDSLDSLKSDLVVTALYDDQSTETVTNYTLSGTLTAGTSTITVSYGGKTTTFTVTVTAAKTLSSISVVYTQSGAVFPSTPLDNLKSDLVVTATYSDSSSSPVASADYTLSGTLTAGTSSVTVSYSGKTTTFNVTVTDGGDCLANWDFTQSLIDDIDGNEITLNQINANGTLSRTSEGIVFTGYSQTGSSNTHDNAATANSDSNAKFPLSTQVQIRFGTMTPNFYTNGGDKGSQYSLANGMLLSSPVQLYFHGVSDKFSGYYSGSWQDSWYTTKAPDYFSNKTLDIKVDFLGRAIASVAGETIVDLPAETVSSDGYIIGFGRNGQAYHDAIIKNVSIYEIDAIANIAHEPYTLYVPSSTNGSWDSQTGVGSVSSSGASNYPNIILNNLLYKYSQASTAVFRFSATVTITGVQTASGNGIIIAAGLYNSKTPHDSGNSRKASKTLWTKNENGTFNVEYEETVSEMFTGSSLDSNYLGLSIFANAPNGVTGTISNIKAELYLATSSEE